LFTWVQFVHWYSVLARYEPNNAFKVYLLDRGTDREARRAARSPHSDEVLAYVDKMLVLSE